MQHLAPTVIVLSVLVALDNQRITEADAKTALADIHLADFDLAAYPTSAPASTNCSPTSPTRSKSLTKANPMSTDYLPAGDLAALHRVSPATIRRLRHVRRLKRGSTRQARVVYHIGDVRDALAGASPYEALYHAARAVVTRWEKGDLAAAVRDLDQAIQAIDQEN